MIKEKIFNNIQNSSSRSLCYLFYLSVNNKWINVGEDLYKVSIKHIVKEVQKHEGNHSYWAEENEPVDTKKEAQLKLQLSQSLYSVTVLGGGSRSDYYGRYKDLLSVLNLNIDAHFFGRLGVNYLVPNQNDPDSLESQMITICLYAENFDAIFANSIDVLDHDDARIEMIKHYQDQKNLAYQEAKKNALWLAAAAGNHEILEELLNDKNDVNLNSVFDGKFILKAMFDADPATNLPFKNIMFPDESSQNYSMTLNLLIKHGLDKDKIKQFYNHYYLNDKNIFKLNSKDKNGIIALLNPFVVDNNEAKLTLSI